MALFSNSPGVVFREIDQTAGVEQTSTTDGAFAGVFRWGPVSDVTLVTSEDDLIRQFGKPDANTAAHFLTATAFLAYGNKLRLVRVVDQDRALNATSDFKTLTGTVTCNATSNSLSGTSTLFDAELKVGQAIKVGSNTSIKYIGSITNNTTATLTSNGVAASSNTFTAAGVLIINDDDYTNNYESGSNGFGPWAAKYPGTMGNSLKISVCASASAYSSTPSGTITANTTSTTVTGTTTAFDTELANGDIIIVGSQERQVISITNSTSLTVNTVFTTAFTANTFGREWEFAYLFDAAPGTSEWATDLSGSSDEMHVVVADLGINWTNTANTVLESYAFLSKAIDAKLTNGQTNYYKDAINRRSNYIRWMDHATSSTSNWGSAASATTFGAASLPDTDTLLGALDGTSSVSAADLVTGYDLFASDEHDISLVIGPPCDNLADATSVGTSLVSMVESRGDCVVFLSPPKDAVVDNADGEVDDVIAWRNTLPSSSYAFLDSGWKYALDRYNDTRKWVPLSGDTAGLAARTDRIAAPWFSIAGFSRGNIKNALKLAFNPTKAQQDDLYKSGVNPVIAPRGQGIVLMGDKTALSRPSAFDRINVRRLFIVLEKTISSAAEGALFEFNDEFTRAHFVNLIEPFLRDVQAQRGLTDFRVVCDETNNPASVVDANEFRGDIYIKPARSINFIQLSFVAVRSGVSFDEVVTGVSEI